MLDARCRQRTPPCSSRIPEKNTRPAKPWMTLQPPDRVMHFNNCKNRSHERRFGPGAYYDLHVTGIQASQAVGLPVGQECVVATMAPDKRVTFTWYSFLKERRLRERGSEDRTLYRVLFGDSCWLRHSRKRLQSPIRVTGPSSTSGGTSSSNRRSRRLCP